MIYTNYINILANDKEFLKYIEIWNKIKDLFKNLFNKRFESEPIYNNEYTKAKINPYNINFQGNKTPFIFYFYLSSIISKLRSPIALTNINFILIIL